MRRNTLSFLACLALPVKASPAILSTAHNQTGLVWFKGGLSNANVWRKRLSAHVLLQPIFKFSTILILFHYLE